MESQDEEIKGDQTERDTDREGDEKVREIGLE